MNVLSSEAIDDTIFSRLDCAIEGIVDFEGDSSTMSVAMYFVGGLFADKKFQLTYAKNGIAIAYIRTFCGNIKNDLSLKVVVEQLCLCFNKFGCADKQSVLCSIMDRTKQQRDVDVADEVIDKCIGIYNTENDKLRAYCVAEFKKFVTLSELQKQTRKFNDSVAKSDFDNAIKEYGNGIVKAIGEYKETQSDDNEFDLCFIEEDEEKNIISWGVPSIDEWCGGGIRKGGICILSAPSGYGKSNWAIAVSEYNARHNKKVLHISLEMQKKIVVRRYFSRLSGVPFDLIQSYIKYDRNGAENTYNEYCGYIKENKLTLLNGSYSASDIRLYMEQQRACGIEYDLVVLDYFDKLKSENDSDNSKYDKGGAMNILECIAEDFDVALLTFSQTTSDFQNGNKKSNTKVMSGCIEKTYNATMCLLFDKVDKDGKIIWQLTCSKSRHTEQITEPIIFNYDGGVCRFYDYDKQNHQDYPNKKQENKLIAELIDYKRSKRNSTTLEIPNADDAMDGLDCNEITPWK